MAGPGVMVGELGTTRPLAPGAVATLEEEAALAVPLVAAGGASEPEAAGTGATASLLTDALGWSEVSLGLVAVAVLGTPLSPWKPNE